jgi:NADPH-dependent 2,4-dienoyl-CoA reductase/sulfur reductase-like enzyme
MTKSTPDPLRVLIAGGDAAALDAATAHAGAGARIDLLAPERHFVDSVSEPFELVRTARRELAEIAGDRGFGLIRDAVERVDPEAHQVLTQGGATLDYDVLVLSLAARPRLTVPGALCFRGPQDLPALRNLLLELQPGARVGYVVDERSTWPLPAYELALMTERWSHAEQRGLGVVLVTSEFAPLGVFGANVSERVRRGLAERGIELHTERVADRFDRTELHVEWNSPIPLDAAIALPALTGPAVPGIPRDTLGFAPVDEHGRVRGVSDVYAVGEMASPRPPDGDDRLSPLWAIMSPT